MNFSRISGRAERNLFRPHKILVMNVKICYSYASKFKYTVTGEYKLKKVLTITLVLCLVFAGFLTWKNYTPKEKPADAEASVSTGAIDAEAIFALHAPDEVVMTIGEDEITWSQYYYYLMSNISYISNQFMYFGGVDWSLPVDEEGKVTVSDMVNDMSAQNLQQIFCATRFAEQNGVVLNDEQQAAVDKYIQDGIVSCCGEGATEEDFNKYLDGMHLPRSVFDMNVRWSYLDNNCFDKLYGENGSFVSDEAALAYVAANGYVHVNHILLLCTDPATGDALDDAAKAEKLAQAEALAKELRECESTEALLELFAQRKEELDEDSGKAGNPDGYIFNESTNFVPEFKAAGAALGEYEVSDPVESSYGYHVMLRLPIGPEDIVDEERGYSARLACAVEEYNDQLIAYMDSCPIEYAPGFENVNVQDFVK